MPSIGPKPEQIRSVTADRLIGRTSSGTGRGEQLTAAAARTLLGVSTFDPSSPTVSGIVGTASETTNTPSGTTQTVTMATANHQTLDLSSSTGDVTVTCTVPSVAGTAGTLIVTQHGSTARDITWAVSAGTLAWIGTEPTWSSDTAGSSRVVSWRYDGSRLLLQATEAVT